MTPIHTETLHGFTLEIVPDQCCENPLVGDDAVRLAIYTRNSINPAQRHYPKVEDCQAAVRASRAPGSEWVSFPVYVYSHGGEAYSIEPYSCPWDSGRAGAIFLRRADFRREDMPPMQAYRKTAETSLQEYEDWAGGNCWGYEITDPEGETVDSCWGFIGDCDEYVMEHGRAALESYADEGVREANAALAVEIEASRPDMYAGVIS